MAEVFGVRPCFVTSIRNGDSPVSLRRRREYRLALSRIRGVRGRTKTPRPCCATITPSPCKMLTASLAVLRAVRTGRPRRDQRYDFGKPKNRWIVRHSFESLLSDSRVGLEDIADLCGHSGTTVTELVYRHQLRPVLLQGAAVMDRIFAPAAEG